MDGLIAPALLRAPRFLSVAGLSAPSTCPEITQRDTFMASPSDKAACGQKGERAHLPLEEPRSAVSAGSRKTCPPRGLDGVVRVQNRPRCASCLGWGHWHAVLRHSAWQRAKTRTVDVPGLLPCRYDFLRRDGVRNARRRLNRLHVDVRSATLCVSAVSGQLSRATQFVEQTRRIGTDVDLDSSSFTSMTPVSHLAGRARSSSALAPRTCG